MNPANQAQKAVAGTVEERTVEEGSFGERKFGEEGRECKNEFTLIRIHEIF